MVGQGRLAAKSTLGSHHIEYISEATCDAYLKTVFKCKIGQKSDLYSLNERTIHGNIYLEYENGVIVGIAWEFYLLPHVDT